MSAAKRGRPETPEDARSGGQSAREKAAGSSAVADRVRRQQEKAGITPPAQDAK